MNLIRDLLFRPAPTNDENELRLRQSDFLQRHMTGKILGKKRISISGSAHLMRGIADEVPIEDFSYPDVDCRNLPVSNGTVDVYLSDQVLEHIGVDASSAFEEAFRVLRPDGIAIVSTCFMNPMHMEPDDYLRFTPYALRRLAEESGFSVIQHFEVGNEVDFVLQRIGGAGRQYRKWTRLLRDLLSRKARIKSPIIVGVILQKNQKKSIRSCA